MLPPARQHGFDVLLEVARDLTASLAPGERYGRLLGSVRRIVPCDAACLLRLDGDHLVPVAAEGLKADALGRRYEWLTEPRLRAVLAAADPVTFGADSPLPDPFDGLLACEPSGRVHACMGCALRDDMGVVGALTVDALDPGAFDRLDSRIVATLAALATAAMRTTSIVAALKHGHRPDADETRGAPCERMAAALGVPDSIGRYQVVRRLGRGTMGSVYLAFDPMIERLIAVKVTSARVTDDAARGRFVAEVRSVGKLHHPSIPIIFDVGEYEGLGFIAMEYVEGRTLAEIIASRLQARVSVEAAIGAQTSMDTGLARVVDWMEQLCSGLAAAHAQGIVHCDIKPANLMIDSGRRLRILDFGISRLPGYQDARPGMLAGTLNYMSPEQARCEPLDPLTDIFSAGLVFHELLTGRPAFAHRTFTSLDRRREARPRSLPRNIPPAIRRVVSCALQQDRKRRFQSCDEMRAAIVVARPNGSQKGVRMSYEL